MHYKITKKEAFSAKTPHHIFNLNVILTHLAMSKVALELGDGSPLNFIIIPVISIMVISYLYFKTQAKGLRRQLVCCCTLDIGLASWSYTHYFLCGRHYHLYPCHIHWLTAWRRHDDERFFS